MKLFSKEEINQGRQDELDFLRGFTAFLLVIVHVGFYVGNNITTGMWVFLDLIGSEWCAPVLMVLMGMCVAYSRDQSPGYFAKRGVKLLLLGFLISTFRSLLPYLILGEVNEWATPEAFFVVDILPFAGLSFLLLALLRKIKCPLPLVLVLSLGMVLADQYLMLPESFPTEKTVLTGLVNLFVPTTEWSCFPLLTWFFFPAVGLCFGKALRHCADKNKLYAILLPVGAVGVAFIYWRFYCLYPNYADYYYGGNYYYMGVVNVLLALSFIFLTLGLWHYLGKILPAWAKQGLVFMSRNLNTYYIVSWFVISLLIHLQTLCEWQFGNWATVGITVAVMVLCVFLTKGWLSVKKKIDYFIKSKKEISQ